MNNTQTVARKTILVVEDSSTQSLHLRALLEDAGVGAIVANNGFEGVQMAQVLRPDLIVLDVQMPGMNGLQVCEALKQIKETCDIPIIMLTRHDDPEMVALGMQSGITDYIPKDAFADVVLIETLKEMEIIPHTV
ncbi:MAG: response regulator [Anaerolineae bacterium]|nr:response regulator [Anaerolineae bacterium]